MPVGTIGVEDVAGDAMRLIASRSAEIHRLDQIKYKGKSNGLKKMDGLCLRAGIGF